MFKSGKPDKSTRKPGGGNAFMKQVFIFDFFQYA
jgi:hypothetical protein